MAQCRVQARRLGIILQRDIDGVAQDQPGIEGEFRCVPDRVGPQPSPRRLQDNKQGEQRRERAAAPSLLAGRIFDAAGRRLTPSHAQKGPKRYRYYVSQHLTQDGVVAEAPGLRITAGEVEGVVVDQLQQMLRDEALMYQLLDCQSAPKKDPPSASKRDPLSRVHRPTVSPGAEP